MHGIRVLCLLYIKQSRSATLASQAHILGDSFDLELHHHLPTHPLHTFASRSLPLLTVISVQSKGLNYGFVEYDDPGAAERAMSTLNGRRVHQSVS